MQSRVVAFAVLLSHSTSIPFNCSGVIATAATPGPCARLFFGFGTAFKVTPFVGDTRPVASSTALRFFGAEGLSPRPIPALGLAARLSVTGLVGRLPRGLFPRLILFNVIFGGFGLVARLATTECPPRVGDPDGDAACPVVA